VGTRAALFGNEAGRFEAWVYPLKIFRNFRLLFHTDGRELPAESLARTVTVRPESCTIVYAGDTFQVRETLFVPVKEPGAVIVLEVETAQPLEIEAVFQRDFQLEWPAALGGTYMGREAPLHAFSFGEEQKKYAALVGSPTGVLHSEEYNTNYSSSEESSFLLGPTPKGEETKLIVIAGSVQGLADAQGTYDKLLKNYGNLLRESGEYYRKYLDQTVGLELPDAALQQAYDWARVSMVQGLVTNPYLGTGLIAGYRTSGSSQRPGFAWFFGRDSLWTALALHAEGDFATSRTALDFISKHQRADGKIPHEISQGANFVDWFKGYPYGYASADATPLYIIAMEDYVRQSGDLEYGKEKWDSVWKAYQFLKSTCDAQNLPQNFGIGHGWVEGGPLLPVKTELYQSGLGAVALHSLSNLAKLVGKEDVSKELDQAFVAQRTLVNQTFWSAEKNFFSFALDRNNQRVEIPSVLATVPMWFGLLDEQKSEATLNLLADSDHQTDWGMRIISSRDAKYNPGGYHFGSVWPLFTGWASVGEYRYHRAFPAYLNLRVNALLASDGAMGHVTEVLSGNYYQPLSTSSPHQIWSAAMVVSPILRGMLGLEVDAFSHQLKFAPHVPYGWTSVHVSNLRVDTCILDLTYRRTVDSIVLEAKRSGTATCSVEFSPSISLRTSLAGTEINGRAAAVHVEKNSVDQHATVRFPVSSGTSTLRMRLRNDFGLSYSPTLPALGSGSEGLRLVSENWSARMDTLTVDVAGRAGRSYEMSVWNGEQVVSVDGAAFDKTKAKVRIQFSGTGEEYVHSKVVFHFGKGSSAQ
jgi:glycogen debranching enzyme